MDWIGIVTLFSSLATMVGVFIAGFQIKKTSDLHRTQFEDSLSKEYRDLIQKIPVKALFGKDLSAKEFEEAVPHLFHYINLTNDQIFLRAKGRICLATWKDWQSGIEYNLKELPAFKKMWEEVEKESKSFNELRILIDKEFDTDPKYWTKEEPKKLKSKN